VIGLTRAGAAVVLVTLASLALAAAVLAADPSAVPSALPADVLAGGDLRSAGEGPGLVGNPLLILLAVAGLGLATAVVTALAVRLTRRD
jgi:hypothetical protein